jgi:iron complex outermembrane recepter protein
MNGMKPLSRCLALAFGGSLVIASASVYAQDAAKQERIEVTGSSIKRIQAEGALPVTVITQEDIKKSGATSVTDLVQKLPSMQGFITNSESVNGGGGGITSASIHGLGSDYTLVLLNGRRLAPYNTGAAVNLQSIPLSAVERVEVLTDGASALYGADAIAGVVNFILKKNSTEGGIEVTGNIPQKSGAKSYNLGLSKGFGDIDKDGFNVLFAASYDKQDELNASQRDFAKSGLVPFTANGRNVSLFLTSSNSVPGNVALTLPDGSDLSAFYSPYYYANGNQCPALHVPRPGGYGQQVCRFDFSSQVQLIPASERASFFTSGRLKLSDSATLFSELVYSRFFNEPRYAPPAQPGLFLTQGLVDRHVTPLLGQIGVAPGDVAPVGAVDAQGNPIGPTMNVRVFDAGGRKDRYTTNSVHFVAGAEGNAFGIDYTGSFTHSENKTTDTAVIANGTYDPLAQGTGQSAAVLAPGVLHQVLDESKSAIDSIAAKGSRSITALAGGDLALGFGGEYTRQSYIDNPSLISQGIGDTVVGGSGGAKPFNSKRNSFGLYTEIAAPVLKTLELTGALRFDNFGAVSNSKNFDLAGNPIGSAEQGKSSSSTTYKLSARWQPVSSVLVRGSYGTGFKAPTMRNITFPLQPFGSSTGTYDCPFTSGPLASGCRPPNSQYNLLLGGNPSTASDALRPEKSKQWTVGFRVEPTANVSAGLDLWNVSLKDQISQIPEQVAFANGATYTNLFTIAPDPITGASQLTFINKPINLTKSEYRGIDVDVTLRAPTPIGKLTTKIAGTYNIRGDYEIPGLPGFQSSLGKFGVDNTVQSRWLANISSSLQAGAFTHTLSATFRPGYKDYPASCTAKDRGDGVLICSYAGPEIRLVGANGAYGGRFPTVAGLALGQTTTFTRDVGDYTLWDWQTKYDFSKELTFTGGIKNVLDTKPPFSVQDAGGGNMRGFDGRYADPIGRSFYLTGSYKF